MGIGCLRFNSTTGSVKNSFLYRLLWQPSYSTSVPSFTTYKSWHQKWKTKVGKANVVCLRDDQKLSSWTNRKYYCWWLKSCTTWDVWNPVNNGMSYTYPLVQDFFHQQYFQVLGFVFPIRTTFASETPQSIAGCRAFAFRVPGDWLDGDCCM